MLKRDLLALLKSGNETRWEKGGSNLSDARQVKHLFSFTPDNVPAWSRDPSNGDVAIPDRDSDSGRNYLNVRYDARRAHVSLIEYLSRHQPGPWGESIADRVRNIGILLFSQD